MSDSREIPEEVGEETPSIDPGSGAAEGGGEGTVASAETAAEDAISASPGPGAPASGSPEPEATPAKTATAVTEGAGEEQEAVPPVAATPEKTGPARRKSAPRRSTPRKTSARKKTKRAAVVAPPPGGEQDFRWYVLRVQSGREDTVSNNLRKKMVLTKMDHLVNNIVVPKQKVTEIKEGKKRIREQKLFPGYVFVEMTLEDDLWYLIRDTSGIGDFVGSHQQPTPMAAKEVRKILDIMEEKEKDEIPEVKIDLIKNDAVKIKEGPFENFDGVVEEVQPSKGMVRVMVTIFGRSTPVDLEYWQVEKL